MPNQPSPTLARLERDYRECPLAPGHGDRMQLAERLAQRRGDGVDWLNLAFERFSAFDFPAGHAALDTAIDRDPDLLAARWLRFQYPDHPAPEDAAEADRFRQRWDRGMAWFEALDPGRPALLQQAAVCIGATTSFYRHYLGDGCLEEQRRYGRFCTAVMHRLIPKPPPLPRGRARPRVLFCSSFLYQHTVARLFLPLIEGLDRDRLDVHLLHLGDRHDAMTERAARIGTLHRGPRSPQQWTALAYQLAADHIVHLDVGMDPTSQLLAASRLAPQQWMLWGHPVTTGLSTIDAFLTPDEGESPDGAAHCTEPLLRMPGLGHGLTMRPAETVVVDRDDTGNGRPLRLFCAQSVYKLQPGFDRVLARILGALPDAELYLIPHQEQAVRDWLRARIVRACDSESVDAAARVHVHGYVPQESFLQLAASCDINLDTPLWSGGMSSSDLIGLGLPTVALEGPLMRARLTAALLRRCGRGDLITHDEDTYVRRVLDLAADRSALAGQRAALAEACAGIDDRERVTQWMQDRLLASR